MRRIGWRRKRGRRDLLLRHDRCERNGVFGRTAQGGFCNLWKLSDWKGGLFQHTTGAIFATENPKSTTAARSQFLHDTNSMFAMDKHT